MDLKQFGEQLRALRQQAGWSQEQLLETLDQLARLGPLPEYRVLDGVLLSRWENGYTHQGRQWKPTRLYTLHLIQLFAAHLDLTGAQQWAAQAGYTLNTTELQAWFPTSTAETHNQTAVADLNKRASVAPHNLPPNLTSFVGRETEIACILDYLATPTTRLITLVGEGGTGKTRLALYVAHKVLNQPGVFADGVYFVSLSSISTANLVVSTLASALEIALAGVDDPERQLLAYLQKRRLLLVLDNFEHLVDSGAPLITAILQAASGVQILITSQQRLNLAEEWVLTLTGLPFPTPQAKSAPNGQIDPLAPGLGMVQEYGAIQLFLARAQQVDAQFDPASDPRQMAAIARICQLLQGIPLGIEMAAAWVHLLSCQEIGDEIAQNLDFLTLSRHNVPARQRSMRAMFEHSWRLLTVQEQAVLAALSVFQGSLTREAATHVAQASLPTLRSLCDKSLLKFSRGRFMLHGLLRQFSKEKLQSDPAREQVVQECHARYYMALAGDATSRLRGINSAAWLDQLEIEYDNLYSALSWTLTQAEQNEMGLRLASALAFYWYQRGQWSEGRTWLTRALAQTKSVGVTRVRTSALLTLGEMLWGQGDYNAARTSYAEALACYRALQEPEGIASALSTLGLVEREQGDTQGARKLLEECLGIFRHHGNELSVAWVLCSLGEVAVIEENSVQATALLEESLQIFHQLGDQLGIAWASNHLAHVAQLCRDYRRATALHEANLVEFRKSDRNGMAWTFNGLASVAIDKGDYQGATAYYRESLALFRQLESKQGIVWCIAGLGCAAAGLDQSIRAVRLWGAADALLASIGARPAPATKQRDQQAITSQHHIVGNAAFTLAWDEGRRMSLAQAIAYALLEQSMTTSPTG